jgi:cell division protease FtsH
MKKNDKFSVYYWIGLFFMFLLIDSVFFAPGRSGTRIFTYDQFIQKVDSGKVERVLILPEKIIGEIRSSKEDTTHHLITNGPAAPWRLRLKSIEDQIRRQFIVNRLPNVSDQQLLNRLLKGKVIVQGKYESHALKNFFLDWIFPFIFLFALWGFLYKRMGPGNPMLDLGKSKAKILAEKPENPVKFTDVAGVDEAVEEVKELVDFLKNPKKYTQLGGKLPKGVLLVGPPGTGKTLLAKAVAGEAGVPFFNLSGSDFVEMFVGVGAARVRDLFKEAKSNAPCIIFIDEIDAIGKSRASNAAYGGGYDERENTLNQLLVEMDGFDAGIGVIIMGATNRPEVLDAALLRPGRFDRQVLVDKPDLKGRAAIFKVHTKNLTLDENVDIQRLAAQTPGFAGAEIANVCNEAAILAVRKKHDKIMMSDFEEAIERVIAGLEKKNKIINEKERKIVAYHESGHAIVGYFTEGADEIQKVSIVPRGIGALGYTLQMPLEDRYLMSKTELLGKIKGLLGGRAAEEIVFGDISTGASNDLEKVAQLAKNMITVYGMSEKLPNISLVSQSGPGFLGNPNGLERRSEYMERIIDEEVQKIISECYEDAKRILKEKRDKLEKMAQVLLEKEVIEHGEIEEILGK